MTTHDIDRIFFLPFHEENRAIRNDQELTEYLRKCYKRIKDVQLEAWDGAIGELTHTVEVCEDIVNRTQDQYYVGKIGGLTLGAVVLEEHKQRSKFNGKSV